MQRPVSVQSLISSIELNNYGIIWSKMQNRKNHHFFADRVRKPNNAYFDFMPNSAEWSDRFLVTSFVNIDGFKFDEVLIDLKLMGTINEYNNSGKTFFSEPIELAITIRAYIQDDGWVGSENIHLLNSEQKSLLEFYKKYEEELKKLGVKTIFETEFHGEEAFGFFTRVWKNVDRENPTMVEDTSMHYFHELGESHRNIMYSVSCANMWGRYSSHFIDNSYRMNDRVIYPHNPTFYDTRHIFYLETAIEELYTFYERIAYIAYLFLIPVCFEYKSLSYNKLFEKRTIKDLKLNHPDLENNPHFNWFVARLKKEHKTLSEYRHPLIHYKTTNKFIKGSYSASRTRYWLSNAANGEKELSKLHTQMEEILKFANRELLVCATAFEQIVLLCESLDAVDDEQLRHPIGEK